MLYRIILIFFLSLSISAEAKVDTLRVKSLAMNGNVSNLIILPNSPQSGPLPVIYLLHGAGGDFGNWMRRAPFIEDLAEELGVIIVCPDGYKQSWYLNSPELSESQYETYFIEELLPTIDSLYDTKPSSDYRAITGLSMGGHGALYLALRHPELFNCAGSMSGGVDLRPFPNNWGLPVLLGDIKDYPSRWSEHSVVEIAAEEATASSSVRFIIDCGLNDFFLDVNRELDRVMTLNGIQHVYSEREGAHNWQYWRVSVVDHFRFFAERFAKN